MISSRQLDSLRRLSRGIWIRLILLGLLYYAVTQGAVFLSLYYLPAITSILLFSFTGISMGIGSMALLITGIVVQGLLVSP